MKHALVTGASGFVGSHLVEYLQTHGCRVSTAKHGSGYENVDLSGVDVVYHLAGLAHAGAVGSDEKTMHYANVTLTQQLYETAVTAGVKKFIWLSSIKVLGDVSDGPLAEDAAYNPGDLYARSKVAAEKALLSIQTSQTQLCIVRPPLVYGCGVKANFRTLLKLADSNWPLPLKSATAARSWLSVNNLVDFLFSLGSSTQTLGQTIFHVKDGQDTSVGELVCRLREAAGRSTNLWPFSPRLALIAGKLMGRADTASRLFEPLQLDSQHSERNLAWSPPFSQQDELVQVMQWHQAQ